MLTSMREARSKRPGIAEMASVSNPASFAVQATALPTFNACQPSGRGSAGTVPAIGDSVAAIVAESAKASVNAG